jgi:hypothetical protein
MAHPATDRQGAKDKVSGNLKKARGRLFFNHFNIAFPDTYSKLATA